LKLDDISFEKMLLDTIGLYINLNFNIRSYYTISNLLKDRIIIIDVSRFITLFNLSLLRLLFGCDLAL